MNVGFIGLGRMGQGMALNLLKAGVSLVVHDKSVEAVKVLVDAGAQAASNVADLARRVEVVFTSLPGPAQVEEVVLGRDGLVENMAPGLVLFELSTNSLALNRRIYDAFKRKGGAMMDAPVSGGPAGAASGDLALWIGGDQEVYDRHIELLRKFADKPRRVGEIGAGTIVKLANNVAGVMLLEVMAEVFTLAVKGGIEPLEMWQALRLGVVGKQSPIFMLTNQFLPGNFDAPAFALKLSHKDAMLATNLAKELGVPMRLANMTLEEMTEALGRGWGERDTRSFLQLQTERAGVKIAVDPQRIKDAMEGRLS
jgi:3-hydroxyisobutyrate dehydrogenase